GSRGEGRWASHQSSQSHGGRARCPRLAGGGADARPQPPCAEREQRRRLRAGLRNPDAIARGRARHRFRGAFHRPQPAARRARPALRGADDLPKPRVRRCWRSGELWRPDFRRLPPDRRLRRPSSEGRKTGRPTGPTGNQSRAVHQPQDRQGARHHRAAAVERPRRRVDRVKRRQFITLLGGAAAAWPLAGRAQQAGKLPTIGFMGATYSVESQRVAAFVQRLRELAWVDGRNLTIEYRWAEGRPERVSEIAAEFVRIRVDVIVTVATPATLAAKQATAVIPIVGAPLSDPVGTGLVASLARPGRNVTGLANQISDTVGKKLEFLREVVPD